MMNEFKFFHHFNPRIHQTLGIHERASFSGLTLPSQLLSIELEQSQDVPEQVILCLYLAYY